MQGHEEELAEIRSKLWVRSNFFINWVLNVPNRPPAGLITMQGLVPFRRSLDQKWDAMRSKVRN